MMAGFWQGFAGRFLTVFRGAKARCLWDSGPIGPIQLFWAFVSSGGFFGILGFRVPWVSLVSEFPWVTEVSVVTWLPGSFGSVVSLGSGSVGTKGSEVTWFHVSRGSAASPGNNACPPAGSN